MAGMELIKRRAWGPMDATLTPRALDEITLAVVHHEAGAPLATHRHCDDRVRSIDHYHRVERGWFGGIGYHRLICPHGDVYEGRPLNTLGAHAPEANRTGIGYCLMGKDGQETTDEALSALLGCIRADEALLGRGLKLVTHREIAEPGHTACPGKALQAAVDRIRRGKVKTAQRTHKVAKGETLWGIAQRYYRDGSKWQRIAVANRIDDPALITPGQVLAIP